MNINFTKEDLKHYMPTYKKGLAYFENGAVGDIKTSVDRYVAKVTGSQVYRLEYSPAENKFSCNCPVNGFCKHIVAFGLKLLEEKEHLPATKDFEEWYRSVDNDIKASFLKRIISKDSRLKSKFEKYVSGMTKKEKDPGREIEEIAGQVYDILCNLSWEEAMEEYSYDDGYMEDYEMVDALVEENLNEFNTEVSDMVSQGKIEDAFSYFLGVYLGINRASTGTEIAEYCDYLEFPISGARNKLFNAVGDLPPQKQKNIFDLFTGFFEKHTGERPDYFSELLEILLKNNELKPQIKRFLSKYASGHTAKKLLMTIAEDDKDILLMQKVLEGCDVASLFVPYLNILFENGEFDKIKTILRKFAGKSDICTLKDFIVPQIGTDFYKELLLRLITRCFDLEYYIAYKKVAGDRELETFLKDLSANIGYENKNHSVPVLFYEKMYDPVLRFFGEESRSEYGFDEYLPYLVNISKTKPSAVWEILKERTDFFFKQKKRAGYGRMANYLRVMLKIDRDKTSRLISDYYNHKPVLRALRDEFENAGIV